MGLMFAASLTESSFAVWQRDPPGSKSTEQRAIDRHLTDVMIQNIARSEGSKTTAECEELVDLAVILDPKVHIAIWRRSVDQRIANLLGREDCFFRTHSRFVSSRTDLDRVRDIAELVPAAARAADPVGVEALAADIFGLTEMFAELVCADELMVSLESPDEATCPRFHVDRIGIRMLVTYVGPGTEWLPDEHVDRRWLGSPGHGRPDEKSGLMLPGSEVQRVSQFDVVLLKGEAWPGAEGFGAVHRSPDPVGKRRVLLRVDMLSQSPVGGEVDD